MSCSVDTPCDVIRMVDNAMVIMDGYMNRITPVLQPSSSGHHPTTRALDAHLQRASQYIADKRPSDSTIMTDPDHISATNVEKSRRQDLSNTQLLN